MLLASIEMKIFLKHLISTIDEYESETYPTHSVE